MVYWAWVLLGLALLVVEVATPGGFFALFFGVSALVVALLVGFGWGGPAWMQWLLFSSVSLVALALLRKPLQARLSLGMPARPVETAQATPPRPQPQPVPQQPMQRPADDMKGPFGGLFYVKMGAGFTMIEEASASGSGTNATVETDLGWGVLGGLGIDLGNNFRVEGETFYASNGTKSVVGTVSGTAVNSSDASGAVSTLAFMANAAYDFTNAYAITPYIFGGAGLAMVSADASLPNSSRDANTEALGTG